MVSVLPSDLAADNNSGTSHGRASCAASGADNHTIRKQTENFQANFIRYSAFTTSVTGHSYAICFARRAHVY